ncbi:MAG: urease accessory protein UreD [Muribaculaceae bacterium]|nr:urease accessory protein UreD [Muribaculaceae bacterium]
MAERYYSDSPKVDFDSAPEMAPYLEQPDAMYIGCPGKHGYLNLGFELDSDGKSILRELDRRAPLIVQQELYFDEAMPEMPCVYILSSGGPNVDGDRYVQNFTVHRNAFAHVSTGAATKLAEMKRNYSGMTQKIVLEEGAYLEYMPEPVIPCRHTRFICDTDIIAHETATLAYSEIYMGGRKYYNDGELFAFDILSVTTHGERPDGQQLFREKFIIDPGRGGLRLTGIMAEFDVFANVVVVTPPESAAAVYDATVPFIDRERDIAAGITHLPNGAGLLFKVLGKEPGPVKAVVREFCSKVRMAVKGKPIPPEFPWR